MEIASIVLSILAIVFSMGNIIAVAVFCLWQKKKKAEDMEKLKAVSMSYAEKVKIEIQMEVDKVGEYVSKVETRLDDIENGNSPTFEASKKAAESMNAFANGVAAIWGYDPLKAMEQKKAGEET